MKAFKEFMKSVLISWVILIVAIALGVFVANLLTPSLFESSPYVEYPL